MTYALIVLGAIVVLGVIFCIPYAGGEADKKMRVIMDKYRREKGEAQ